MLIPFKPFLKNYCKLWGAVAPLNLNGFKKKYRDIYMNVRNHFIIGSNGFDMEKQAFFKSIYFNKIYNFEMPYPGKFWSNFKKIGTVVIGKTRSLI